MYLMQSRAVPTTLGLEAALSAHAVRLVSPMRQDVRLSTSRKASTRKSFTSRSPDGAAPASSRLSALSSRAVCRSLADKAPRVSAPSCEVPCPGSALPSTNASSRPKTELGSRPGEAAGPPLEGCGLTARASGTGGTGGGGSRRVAGGSGGSVGTRVPAIVSVVQTAAFSTECVPHAGGPPVESRSTILTTTGAPFGAQANSAPWTLPWLLRPSADAQLATAPPPHSWLHSPLTLSSTSCSLCAPSAQSSARAQLPACALGKYLRRITLAAPSSRKSSLWTHRPTLRVLALSSGTLHAKVRSWSRSLPRRRSLSSMTLKSLASSQLENPATCTVAT
mmetsp:Transcript_99612/g.214936  ORF Transcript_99612/g.214936 Transcript_99612/m.214936 type:complete len:336 (-) Transcript_99612:5410-6417(-)